MTRCKSKENYKEHQEKNTKDLEIEIRFHIN